MKEERVPWEKVLSMKTGSQLASGLGWGSANRVSGRIQNPKNPCLGSFSRVGPGVTEVRTGFLLCYQRPHPIRHPGVSDFHIFP